MISKDRFHRTRYILDLEQYLAVLAQEKYKNNYEKCQLRMPPHSFDMVCHNVNTF